MFVSGGRFKKEVVIDGQSFLLLVRDEGGAPEMQVRCLCTMADSYGVLVYDVRFIN